MAKWSQKELEIMKNLNIIIKVAPSGTNIIS